MKKLIFAIATALLLGTFIYLNSCSSTLQVAPIRSTSDLKTKDINLPEEAILRIGYSTVLIKSKDSYILIDPWFSEKAAYYHGKDSLAMSVNQLPNLTTILTSQDHYDHFDIETLSTYPNKNVPFFVCSGSKQKDKALKFNFTNVIEPENFETISLGNIKITSFEGRSNEKPSSFD